MKETIIFNGVRVTLPPRLCVLVLNLVLMFSELQTPV